MDAVQLSFQPHATAGREHSLRLHERWLARRTADRGKNVRRRWRARRELCLRASRSALQQAANRILSIIRVARIALACRSSHEDTKRMKASSRLSRAEALLSAFHRRN